MKFILHSLRRAALTGAMIKKISLSIVLFAFVLVAQKLNVQKWIESIEKGNRNFYEIQRAFYKYYDSVKAKEEDKPGQQNEEEEDGELAKFKRWEWFMEPRVYPSGDITLPSRNLEEFQKYLHSRSLQRTNESAQVLSGNWTSLGPFTVPTDAGIGRINFIRFDPINSNIIWVGSPGGGLWKSTNGGVSWITQSDFLTVIGCSDIIIDPANTNIMYLATGDCDWNSTNSIGVLKSTDGGISWNNTGLSWPVNSYYKIHKLLIHPTNSNIILAATSDGIYKTIDAGATWTQRQTGYFTDIEFKPGAPDIEYAVTKVNGSFYKSTNTGTDFSLITSGLPSSSAVYRLAIAVTPANANYVYVIAVNKTNLGFYGLYRSTNSGTSFTARSNTPDIIGGQGSYNLAIAANASNANDIYVGGLFQYRSTDGGINWSQLAYIHADVHALDFLPGSSTTIFSGNDGGIFKSTNNGTSWTDLSNGLVISQIYRLGTSATNANLNLLGLQDNGNVRQNGSNCADILFADGMESIIDYTNENIVYAGSQNGNIVKSIDGGQNIVTIVNNYLTGVDEPSDWITPYVIHPTDHNTLLVGKSQLYRSTNGSMDWSQVGSVSLTGGTYTRYLTSLAYAPSNPNYIYAASRNLFYTSINGNLLTDRTGTLPIGMTYISYIAVSNVNPNKVWVTFSGYAPGEKVYMSNDAGVTWINYSDSLPNLPVNCIVYQNGSNDALYVGTDVGVYYRNNAMPSWQPYFNGLPHVVVNELEIQYSAGKLRAATYGRGLWETDIVPGCTPPSKTWIGMVSTAWENPANWSCGTLPDANTDVIINSGTIVLSSNQTIKSFTTKPGVNFTVTPS